MESVILIAKILSGLFGAFFTIQFFFTLYEMNTYNGSTRQLRDRLQGYQTTFTPNKPLAKAVILLTIFFVLL